MSNQLPQATSSRLYPLLASLVLGVFTKGCAMPGWPSVLELFAVLSFASFVFWYAPGEKQVSPKMIDELKEKLLEISRELTETKGALKGLKIKIGLQ